MQSLLRPFGTLAAKVFVVVLFGVPAFLSMTTSKTTVSENRRLAALPERPSSLKTALAYPAKLDAWINDHFGLRAELVELNNIVRYKLFKDFPTTQVVEGKDDRLFLAAHSLTDEPYGAIYFACGYQAVDTERTAGQIADFLQASASNGTNAKLMIALSSPALYTNELPDWLRDRCNSGALPMPRVLKSKKLNDDMRTSIFYPMDQIQRIEQTAHVVPKRWFHWAGTGPKLLAQASVKSLWKIDVDKVHNLVSKTMALPSDISHFFPGVVLTSDVEVANFEQSGVIACLGGHCFPEMLAAANKLGDVSRYRNPHVKSGRLVLITDSFGAGIAGWYSSFFSEVVHLSTNNLSLLDPSELAELKKYAFAADRNSRVLFLYHDVNLLIDRLQIDSSKLLH